MSAENGCSQTNVSALIHTLTAMTTQELNNQLAGLLTGMGITPTAINDQANFTHDLGLDSLDVTDLRLQVETIFGLRIPDEDWWQLQTVGQVKEYLTREMSFDEGQPA